MPTSTGKETAFGSGQMMRTRLNIIHTSTQEMLLGE